MSLHKEISFESEICQHLGTRRWLYAEGDAAGYDHARALFPADVLAWMEAPQPQAWEVG
jgi:type I restriction enzyme, R subunit